MEQSNLHALKILVCPLDWGLGHATRCIPIINLLIDKKVEVWIAADKLTFSLLSTEFPDLNFLRLPGYEIHYSRKRKMLPLTLLTQFPKLITSIRKEHLWLKNAIKKYQFDAVISDNRMGLYTKQIPCVYLTHQLAIQTGTKVGNYMAKKIHEYFIQKYDECWVPDYEKNGLAGNLSHTKTSLKSVKYIGGLSRFEKVNTQFFRHKYLFLLSGPEPQRSILEQMILKSLHSISEKVFIVRGLPDSTEKFSMPNSHVSIINHLSAKELNRVIQESEHIICRSGYTTLMDLVKLQKSAILIPTPGQTEQEYLAHYLSEKGLFTTLKQKDFSIEQIITLSAQKHLLKENNFEEEYKEKISDWLRSLENTGK